MPSYISDRYKVGRMLGDGNFAVVRECVEHSTGREYALKIINKGKCRGKVQEAAAQDRWRLSVHVFCFFESNTDCVLTLFAGAHDSERSGHPAPGQTSKRCPAYRGGGHIQRTISGHGARQG